MLIFLENAHLRYRVVRLRWMVQSIGDAGAK